MPKKIYEDEKPVKKTVKEKSAIEKIEEYVKFQSLECELKFGPDHSANLGHIGARNAYKAVLDKIRALNNGEK